MNRDFWTGKYSHFLAILTILKGVAFNFGYFITKTG